MNQLSVLTPREYEIAELLAWGAAKKEIPDLLKPKAGRQPISINTVDNITRSIYEKLSIQKVNELSALYFCTKYNISLDMSPLKRKFFSFIFLLLVSTQLITNTDIIRTRVTARANRICRTVSRARSRRNDTLIIY